MPKPPADKSDWLSSAGTAPAPSVASPVDVPHNERNSAYIIYNRIIVKDIVNKYRNKYLSGNTAMPPSGAPGFTGVRHCCATDVSAVPLTTLLLPFPAMRLSAELAAVPEFDIP